jgi:hypothetical protein
MTPEFDCAIADPVGINAAGSAEAAAVKPIVLKKSRRLGFVSSVI